MNEQFSPSLFRIKRNYTTTKKSVIGDNCIWPVDELLSAHRSSLRDTNKFPTIDMKFLMLTFRSSKTLMIIFLPRPPRSWVLNLLRLNPYERVFVVTRTQRYRKHQWVVAGYVPKTVILIGLNFCVIASAPNGMSHSDPPPTQVSRANCWRISLRLWEQFILVPETG